MTSDALQKMRERCSKATEGPWLTVPTPKDADGWATCSVVAAVARGQNIYAQPSGGISPQNNLAFIAAARQDLPQLLDLVASQAAEIARLRGELAKLREPRKLPPCGMPSHYHDCDCGGGGGDR